jgi:hypothetical protein
LEAQQAYGAYDMNQPWDSPANDAVKSMMPDVFRCPSDPNTGQYTDYVVVTGAETLFDGSKQTKFSDVIDGLSNTIMVVEAVGMNIPWTEPRDLDFNRMSMTINSQPGNCVHSHHPGVALVLLGDGSVRQLNTNTPPETLRALLTKAGREQIMGDF